MNGYLYHIPTAFPPRIVPELKQKMVNNAQEGYARFYEWEIDSAISVILNYIFAPVLGYCVAPQATYNEEVDFPEDFSTQVAQGDTSFLGAFPNIKWVDLGDDDDEESSTFLPKCTSSPNTSWVAQKPHHLPPGLVDYKDFPSFIPNTAGDDFGRLVDNTPGQLNSKKPDFITKERREIVVISKNKTLKKGDAIRQLKGYMKDLWMSNCRAIGMASIGGPEGLESSFWKWESADDNSEIVQVSKDHWFLVNDPFVFSTLLDVLLSRIEVISFLL